MCVMSPRRRIISAIILDRGNQEAAILGRTVQGSAIILDRTDQEAAFRGYRLAICSALIAQNKWRASLTALF